VHLLYLEPRETDKNVLKFSKNFVLKFHFLLLGALEVLTRELLLCRSILFCISVIVYFFTHLQVNILFFQKIFLVCAN